MYDDELTIPVRISKHTLEELKNLIRSYNGSLKSLIREVIQDVENVHSQTKCATCGQDVIKKKTDIFGVLGD